MQIHHQAPRPTVRVYSPDTDPKGKAKLVFDPAENSTLQTYDFSMSVNDEKGAFSLTFHPDATDIFDQLEILDIVRIHEIYGGEEDRPDFTGVIRQKKYVVQATESGPRRSVLVSGHCVAGLVQEFKISLDMQAMQLTEQIANEKQLSTELTIALQTNDNSPLPVEDIVKKIWEHFGELSTAYGRLANSEVMEYINRWMGEGIFEFDGSEFYYPLGNIFHGQNTQSFYDTIEGLVPRPVYEIFPYTQDGITKIRIRIAPFDPDAWAGLPCTAIDPLLVKSFDVAQCDSEVYTVFYAYLDGSPLEMDRAIILSTQGVKGMPGIAMDDSKFGRYGYRPLHISLHGYRKSRQDDTGTAQKITDLSSSLKDWFCNLDRMFSGTVTMSTDFTGAAHPPQPGEKVKFLGGEFYVTDAHHSWRYGGNPETVLGISRGGDYGTAGEGEGQPARKKRTEIVHTVVTGDTLFEIMAAQGGNGTEWRKIVALNPVLQQREAAGEVAVDGSPLIEPDDTLRIPWLGTEEPEAEAQATAGEFRELKNITARYREFEKGVPS